MIIICVTLVGLLFDSFIRSYDQTMLKDSADHLLEITCQAKRYIEEKIFNDWSVVKSLADSINLHHSASMDEIISHVRREQEIWGISDIILISEDGSSASISGFSLHRDEAAELLYQSIDKQQHMSIIESSVYYTMPLDTELKIDGKSLKAISIVQELKDFIDKMEFSSFDGTSYLYLTQMRGTVISQQSNSPLQKTYNIFSLLEQYTIRSILNQAVSVDELIYVSEPTVVIMDTDTNSAYMAILPIDAIADQWKLFLFAPQDIVDANTLQFAKKIRFLTFAVVTAFATVCLISFGLILADRNRRYSRLIMDRENMFNLLVTNTTNAFILMTLNAKEPNFVSMNSKAVLGLEFLSLHKDTNGFKLEASDYARQASFDIVNQELSNWDGKQPFVSSLIPMEFDKNTKYVCIKIYPILDNPTQFIGMAVDGTIEKEREDLIKNALAMADSANIAKTQFLASMSHDIRTPMNAIVNMTKFAIQENENTPKRIEYLKTIEESSNHLLNLINDILDMSRIESGKMIISNDYIDLLECLDSAVGIITPLYKAKDQNLLVNFSEVKDSKVLGDKLKLTQILTNLLNNAVKFTPQKGNIYFSVSQEKVLKEDSVAFRFVVKDTGIGIDDKDMERIFEPFVRNETVQTRQIEGSGLGLSICKNYVTAMGGSIKCQSQIGIGSVFTVDLAFLKNQAGKPAVKDHSIKTTSFIGKRALLVEDNEINRWIACALLKSKGLEIEQVSNGREAVDKFIQSSEGYFDLIFMDIQMPVLNGYKATKEIRTSQHPQAKTIPIIAMTANVFKEDIEAARVAGMNGHVAKPIDSEELITQISKNIKMGKTT